MKKSVTEMFVTDPCTGLKVPNHKDPYRFMIVREGKGYAIYKSRNEALNNLHKFPEGCVVVET